MTPVGNDALDRAGRVASDPSAFDVDTRVEREGDGVWHAEITPRWSVVGAAPNGGYLMAIVLNALARDVGRPHPLTASAHFLQRAEAGPVEVRTTVEREGRHVTGTARLVRDETTFLLLTATFGNLDDVRGPRLVAAEPPDLPPMDQCFAPPPGMELPPIAYRFDFRLDPASVGWALGQPGGEAYMGGYVRFADGRPADVASLPVFADGFPPAVLNVLPEVVQVPTVELTVHTRARPAPGWLRCVFRTRFLVDGYLEEDGEIWDAKDRLVAMSRQLALVRG